MNLAIVGPSGSGKGTHADHLCSQFGLSHLAIGDLLRDSIRTNSALGILAQKYLEQGELVPDEVVDAMLEEWLGRLPAKRGTLLDGFPRTAGQARFLDGLLQRFERSLDAVIYLHVPDEEIARRIAGRFICRSCQKPYHQQLNPPEIYGVCDDCGGPLYHRPDDCTERVAARLANFHRTIGPVLEHYLAIEKLVIVRGNEGIGQVDAALLEAVTQVAAGNCHFATPDEADHLPHASLAGPTKIPTARETLDVVLLGAPGCGKATQAERLGAELHLPRISTAALFQENVRRHTRLGKLAQAYMERSELVPDEVSDAMIEERIHEMDTASGFILAGYPRNLHQALALWETLARQHRRLRAVLLLRISDAAAVSRLTGRLVCQDCRATYHLKAKRPHVRGQCDHCGGMLYQRPDDSPSTVRARLATFHRQTEPLIEFYRHAGLLLEVNGEASLEEVTRACLRAVHGLTSLPGQLVLAGH